MSLFYLFILATIQGITEFLPISSSGHLILLPALMSHDDQGQVIDVAVHVGTLGAVILYFWADVKEALFGFFRLLRGQIDTRGAFLALCLIISTVPVVVAGLVFNLTGLSDLLRSTAVIGWTMLGFGIVLYWAGMLSKAKVPTEPKLINKKILSELMVEKSNSGTEPSLKISSAGAIRTTAITPFTV